MISIRCLTALLVLALAACGSTQKKETATETAPDANAQLYAVNWMQTALEYQATCEGVYRAAKQRVARAVALKKRLLRAQRPHKKPALAAKLRRTEKRLARFSALANEERLNNDHGQPLAVIVDVDETVLDNSPYQARLIKQRGTYTEQSWDAWSEERTARTIPGALAFATWAERRGVRVFYVSNRKSHLLRSTADNLKAMGFRVDADDANVLLRDEARGWGKDKSSRRKKVDEDFLVVALVGDNLADFLDGIYADQATRQALVAPYRAWWGRKWFMLPNPSYGSWLDTLLKSCGEAKGDQCLQSHLRVD